MAGPEGLPGRLVFGAWVARGGASPWITDSGADERPIRCAASWLIDHVSAAVTAIPRSAATAHRKPRVVTVMTFRTVAAGRLSASKAPIPVWLRAAIRLERDDRRRAAAGAVLERELAAPFTHQLARDR
jgi:hypothetical protein